MPFATHVRMLYKVRVHQKVHFKNPNIKNFFPSIYHFRAKRIYLNTRCAQSLINTRFGKNDVRSRCIIVILYVLFAWKMSQFNFRMKCLRVPKIWVVSHNVHLFQNIFLFLWIASPLSTDMNCFRKMYVSKVKPMMNNNLAMIELKMRYKQIEVNKHFYLSWYLWLALHYTSSMWFMWIQK